MNQYMSKRSINSKRTYNKEGNHTMNCIEVNNLSKTFTTKVRKEGFRQSIRSIIKPEYNHVKAVSDISFEVDKGEIMAFIGPNGAGKSTTIKMLTGILHPTDGSASVLGLNPTKDRRKLVGKIGTVFGQKSQLWFHLPPTDSFRLLADIYEVPSVVYKRRLDFLVDMFEIGNLLKTPVRKLSLGQRIRCEVVASMLHQPDILFLDEPTIGLDVVAKKKIRELIQHINKEYNTTIFLTSHDMGDIEKICQRVMVIDYGQIVFDDNIENLKYGYLKHKRIIVRFNDERMIPDLKGVKIKRINPYTVSLYVDTKEVEINSVVVMLSAGGGIEDITIENPPMEEIIEEIYRNTAARMI